MHRRATSLLIALIGSALSGCAEDKIAPVADTTTFGLLQSEIFDKRCATSGCHVGSSVAVSGNLSLTRDLAWSSLVGVQSTNLAARQDGLFRVRPGRPDSSLLYLKLLATPHAGHDYGNTMPSGGEALSSGQLEYVLQWIAAGATRGTIVANADLLTDKTPQTTAAFQPLPVPAPGTGYQMHVEPFVVTPAFERELFVYRPFGNPTEIYVRRIEFRMRPNSHHFVMYTFPPGTPPTALPAANAVRDIRRSDGSLDLFAMAPMAYHVFFGGSMQTQFAYDFPPGVGLRMPANAALDLNLHYANHTTHPVTGEAYANVYTMDPASVQHVAKALSMPNLGIVLPPNTRTTLEKTFPVTATTTVFGLTSHMHQLGERFIVKIAGGARDGETVYESTDWEHPQLLLLNTPIVLQPGEGLTSIITWNNTTGHTVTFGLLSTDEMGIIFGYYY